MTLALLVPCSTQCGHYNCVVIVTHNDWPLLLQGAEKANLIEVQTWLSTYQLWHLENTGQDISVGNMHNQKEQRNQNLVSRPCRYNYAAFKIISFDQIVRQHYIYPLQRKQCHKCTATSLVKNSGWQTKWEKCQLLK